MGRPICPACPPGTGEHRVKDRSSGCPNEACVNYCSLRRGCHRAERMAGAATAALAELSDALQHRDENGHRIVALKYRADACALRDAVTLLRASNLTPESVMFLAGFLHILYWPWPTMTAVTMFLQCTMSNGIRCWCDLDRIRAKSYVMDIGEKLHVLYDNVCCHQGRSLLLRSHKRTRTGPFPNSTMNPMMRRGSRHQWGDLVEDVRKGDWQNLCRSAVVPIEATRRNHRVKVSYRAVFDRMAQFGCGFYSATSKASGSHYNTIHFLRSFIFALELHSDQSQADWDLLSTMGAGVTESSIPIDTHSVATYCARRISLQLGEPYGIEDLCCFICMLKGRTG